MELELWMLQIKKKNLILKYIHQYIKNKFYQYLKNRTPLTNKIIEIQ